MSSKYYNSSVGVMESIDVKSGSRSVIEAGNLGVFRSCLSATRLFQISHWHLADPKPHEAEEDRQANTEASTSTKPSFSVT